MNPKFLLLLAMCALATALPRDKRSEESKSSTEPSDESHEIKSTTTAKPLPSKIIAIKDAADLETRITEAGDKVVIIFAMTTWCGSSRKAIPIIENIAATTENLIVLKVDMDRFNEDDTVRKYGLNDELSIPRFHFIKDKKKVKAITGSNADIRGTLAKIISHSSESNDSSNKSDE